MEERYHLNMMTRTPMCPSSVSVIEMSNCQECLVHPNTVASDQYEHIWSGCTWWRLCRLGCLSYSRNLDGGAFSGVRVGSMLYCCSCVLEAFLSEFLPFKLV